MFDVKHAKELQSKKAKNVHSMDEQLYIHSDGIHDEPIFIPVDIKKNEIADAIDEGAYSTDEIAGYITVLLAELENERLYHTDCLNDNNQLHNKLDNIVGIIQS